MAHPFLDFQERKSARHPAGTTSCPTGTIMCPGVFAIRRNSKPLSKTLFTLHKNRVSICIKGICAGEELRSTLHHSSPLFTTFHRYIKKCSAPVRCSCGKRGGLQSMQRYNNFFELCKNRIAKSTDFDALFAATLKKLWCF